MKIRAMRRQRSECHDSVKPYIPGTGAAISIGTEYDVHAIACYEGIILFQIVDDLRFPAWYPSALFAVTNLVCPRDWQCNLFSNTETDQTLVIGPAFVAESEAAYGSMVELDADQVNRFWDRIANHS